MATLIGQAIKGYEFRERVGAGATGAVYRCFQPSLGREVAVKVILPQFANQPDFVRRFEVEAQLVARLEHPHIVPLYDYWRDPTGAYLVMRWLRGSLRSSLERMPWKLDATADCARSTWHSRHSPLHRSGQNAVDEVTLQTEEDKQRQQHRNKRRRR